MRDTDLGIGTCLTVFFTKVTDLLSDRTDYRDAIASKKSCENSQMFLEQTLKHFHFPQLYDCPIIKQ